MIKKNIKKFVIKVAPRLFFFISTSRSFLRTKKKFGDFQNDIEEQIYGGQQIIVLSGPFAGMKYFNRIVWSSITPKWLGCYESELHDVIAKITAAKYDVIIDVGAAEGYYAVGFSCCMPETKVVAFDVDPLARRLQKRLGRLNHVANLDVRSFCSHEELRELLTPNSAVVCDIEGSELDLLDPERCYELSWVDILVETHDTENFTASEGAQLLRDRFRSTHSIQTIRSGERDTGELREQIAGLKAVSDEMLQLAACEWRGSKTQSWLWMQAEGK